MEYRENVFTQFARNLNDFVEHKITKLDLYEKFVNYIEMCDEEEKFERLNYQSELEKYRQLPTEQMLTTKAPYSNYEEGKRMLE